MRDDQRIACAMTTMSIARPASVLSQRLRQLGPCEPDDWQRAEYQAGEHGQHRGKSDGREIDRHLSDQRELVPGRALQESQTGVRDRNPQQAAAE